MLLRFKIENSRSFKIENEISLVQSSLKGPEVPTWPVPQLSEAKVLPCALIYGANASGKSNFLKAFRFFRSAILFSHRRGDPEGGVPRVPFRLTKNREAPSSYEADFIVGEVRYSYGFSCDNNRFLEEWLYSYPEGKRRMLFERGEETVEFGGKFTGPKKSLVEFMRPNSLFIATATQNDHPELTPISRFFERCQYSDYMAVTEQLIQNNFSDSDFDDRIIKFLDLVGTGIVNFRVEDVKMPDEFRAFTRDLRDMARKRLGSDVEIRADEENGSKKYIELAHLGEGGDEYFLELQRESSGTRRLLLLMSKIFNALDNGSVILLDELDASLHTLAAEEIVKLFQNPETNLNGAQLIATTHDTNLLSCEKLRRDQIWFCERDGLGASELYSLAEIKSRYNDNFEKGYLEGRYGAIPFSGDAALVLSEED